MRIVSVLFFLTEVLFFLGQLDRIEFAHGIVLHLSDIFVFLTVSVWFISQKNKRRLFSNPYFFALSVFVCAGIASLFLNAYWLKSSDLLVSSLYLWRWISYAGILFVVHSFNTARKRKAFWVLMGTGIAIIFLGFVQYFLYPNLRNLYYLGWDEHLYRMFSTLFDPNFTAVVCNLFLLGLLPWIFRGDKGKWWDRKSRESMGVGLGFFLGFVGLLLTYSRSGFLMFAVGSAVSLWLLEKKRFILPLWLLLAIGILLLPKDLHSAGVELGRTATITARSEAAQQASTIFQRNPVWGVGFDTYRYAQKRYGFADTNWEMSHSGAGTDNSFLFVLATTGIVGLGAFCYLGYGILRKTYRTYKGARTNSPERMLAIVTISSIVGVLVDSFFINSLFYPVVMFWVWVLAGLTLG